MSTRPEWYPDWRKEVVVILGCGPSLSKEQIDCIEGRAKVVVINLAFRAAPFADILYAGDGSFWESYPDSLEFPGLKVTANFKHTCKSEKLHVVTVHPTVRMGRRFSTLPGTLGYGGNSGFQALNLVLQLGSQAVILLGFDMNVNLGGHWHKDHPEPLTNPNQRFVNHWKRAFRRDLPIINSFGARIINASLNTRLDIFPMMSIGKALSQFGRM